MHTPTLAERVTALEDAKKKKPLTNAEQLDALLALRALWNANGEHLATLLRGARGALRWSCDKAGAECKPKKLSSKTIAQVEAGKREPTRDTLRKMAGAYIDAGVVFALVDGVVVLRLDGITRESLPA